MLSSKYVIECDNFDIGFKLFIYLFISFMMFICLYTMQHKYPVVMKLINESCYSICILHHIDGI